MLYSSITLWLMKFPDLHCKKKKKINTFEEKKKKKKSKFIISGWYLRYDIIGSWSGVLPIPKFGITLCTVYLNDWYENSIKKEKKD